MLAQGGAGDDHLPAVPPRPEDLSAGVQGLEGGGGGRPGPLDLGLDQG